MDRARWAAVLLLGVLALNAGCNIIGAIGVMLAPPRVKKAEFKLTEGRVALLVEAKRPEQYNPIFVDALQARVKKIFEDQKIRVDFVPQDEIFRLRQQNDDFAQWSVQKIGRELKVPVVISLLIDDFQLKATPEMPVLEPSVRLHMKVISAVRPKEEARLWPPLTGPLAERDGREMVVSRPGIEATSSLIVDEQAVKLGRDTAWEVASPFYNVDLETPHLREPD